MQRCHLQCSPQRLITPRFSDLGLTPGATWLFRRFSALRTGDARAKLEKSPKLHKVNTSGASSTLGGPHAIAVTTAKVTDRKGAPQGLQRCNPALSRVQALRCNRGYVGKPFAQGVQGIPGGRDAGQIAKRSELHSYKVMSQRGGGEDTLRRLRREGGCEETARGCSTPACSSAIWHFWRYCSRDFEQVLRAIRNKGKLKDSVREA